MKLQQNIHFFVSKSIGKVSGWTLVTYRTPRQRDFSNRPFYPPRQGVFGDPQRAVGEQLRLGERYGAG
jgi:hypothetical protein